MVITGEDKALFQSACQQVAKEHTRQGIGTLSEKRVHAVIKNYILPKKEFHEQPCLGYVADILYEGEIIEIQTANFNTLRRKLEVFLPIYDVTVVYPIPANKWLLWIDEETGEITKKRKSPKKGSYYQAFYELYKIKSFLTNPNLHFRLLLLDIEEYRLLNGWNASKKRGSTRYERIPLDLQGDLSINEVEDYRQLIPRDMPIKFTTKDYQKATKLNMKRSQTALHVLCYIGIINKVGKEGRNIQYEINIMECKRN